MGLDYRGDTIAELRPHGVHGERRLGRHIRLGFNVEMNIIATPPASQGSPTPPSASAPISIHNLSGNISVQTTKQPINLGHLYTDRPFWITTYPQHRTDHVTVYTDLAPDQIEALEEYRSGAGLNFSLNLMALTERQGNVDTKWDQIVFTVNQSAWLDILKQVGHGDFLLFEIPALPVATTETDYLVCLKEARQHLWLGQYDDAVEDCRKALACYRKTQNLDTAITKSEHLFLAKKSPVPSGNDATQKGNGNGQRNDMSKNERFLFLHRATKHLTDTPAHPEGKAPQPFTRQEAISVMSIVAALLATGF